MSGPGRDVVEVYQGKDGAFYWRRQAVNGDVISDGGQGYGSHSDAVRAAERANADIDPDLTD